MTTQTKPGDTALQAALAAACGYHEGPDCEHCADTLTRTRAKGMADRQILADLELFRVDHDLWADLTRLRIALERATAERVALAHVSLGVAPTAVADDQVRAGADALVRLRTQAPSLSELDDEEQVCWLADARAVLEAAGPLAPDGDPRHIIEFTTDGWCIRHPLSCRPDLFGCPVNRAGAELVVSPVPPGRYECEANDLGDRLLIGDRIDPVQG